MKAVSHPFSFYIKRKCSIPMILNILQFGVIFLKKEVECHNSRFFGDLGEYWRRPRETWIARLYSSGNWGVKIYGKNLEERGPQGTP